MKNKQAFTLIELLVVVLIIGILAAVALPQYKIAVAKSRLAAIKPLIRTLKDTQESFYLINGTYTRDLTETDIDIPCQIVKTTDTSFLVCNNFFSVDLHNGDNYFVQALYCPEAKGSYWTTCLAKADFTYTMWLDHSSNPGQIECQGITALGRKICQQTGN